MELLLDLLLVRSVGLCYVLIVSNALGTCPVDQLLRPESRDRPCSDAAWQDVEYL